MMDKLWKEISKVYKSFNDDLVAIEKYIEESIPVDSPPVLYDASRHLITMGGKRIRPVLTLLSYKSVSPQGTLDEVFPIVVAIELIHTATIVHDDIIDRSTKRRGGATVNAKWGDEIAILAGDLLFSEAFGLVGTHRNREVSGIISRTCAKLAEGEVLETLHTEDYDMTEEVYLEVIERKTASLFDAATRTGAIVGGGSKEEVKALARYGYFLGIGFQMIDDLLDITSGENILGKPVGIDIALGKSTFVILHALHHCSHGENVELRKILNKREKNSGDLEKAKDIMEHCGSLNYALKRSKYFVEKGKKELSAVRENPATKALDIIADCVLKREF